MKTAILWIIIVILSLKVFGDWKNSREKQLSREKFYKTSSSIFDKVYYSIEDDIPNLSKDPAKLADRISEELDYLMVPGDHDFLMLSEEEKTNFVVNLAHVSMLVFKELSKQNDHLDELKSRITLPASSEETSFNRAASDK